VYSTVLIMHFLRCVRSIWNATKAHHVLKLITGDRNASFDVKTLGSTILLKGQERLVNHQHHSGNFLDVYLFIVTLYTCFTQHENARGTA
jgi:hypothetical protein